MRIYSHYYIILLYVATMLVSCTKQLSPDADNGGLLTTDELLLQFENIRQKYQVDFSVDFSQTDLFSVDIVHQLEEKIRQISCNKERTKIGTMYDGDDGELLIHCITAFSGGGGEAIIASSGIDADHTVTYSIAETSGYHIPGTPAMMTTHRSGFSYFKVTFMTTHSVYATVEFEGVLEVSNTEDYCEWKEADIYPMGGVWDWQASNLYYSMSSAAICSEYTGTRKEVIVDAITQGGAKYSGQRKVLVYNL